MALKELLRKQGELYKELPDNKAIREYNEIKPKLVQYQGHMLLEQEYQAMKGLEKLLNRKPTFGCELTSHIDEFEIVIENNKITYLRISYRKIEKIPESINNLRNLQKLDLGINKIKEIKNLDYLHNLEILELDNNQIKEIKGLDGLTSLKKINFLSNQIKEIKGLDGLTNLQELYIGHNQITEIRGLDNLSNVEVWLTDNPIPWDTQENREKIKKLRHKKVWIYLASMPSNP